MKALKIFGIAILLYVGMVGIIAMIVGIGYCFWALFGENAIIWLFGIVVFIACLFYASAFIES
jgi:hypothetical protein